PAKTFATGRPEFVNEPMAILAVDLDGDGKTDVATANVTKLPEPAEDYIPDTVSVLIGRGDGTFQSPLNFSVGDAPRGITAADFNGDGFVDIATANSASRQIPGVVAPQDVSILLGRGGGTFFPAQRAIVGGEPSSIIALDLTADGVPDLVTANPGAGTVSVLTGRGDGSFYQSENYTVGGEPVFVTAADLDGDGLHDLATANPATEQVSVLIGDGRGGFFLSAILASAGSADAVAAGDLSGDGKVDLALPNPATDDISILSGPFPGPESIGEGAGTLFVYESDSGSLLSIDMCKTCANSPFLPENTKLHYSRAGLDNELEGQGVIAENPTISFEAIGDQNSLGVTPIALRSPAFKGWFLALESSSRSILAFKKDVDFRRVPPNRSPDREGKPPFPDESSVNFGRGNGLIMSVVITGADIERQIDQQTPRVSRIFELADGRILVFFLTVREVHLLELSLEPLALDFDLDDGDDTAVTVMAPKGKFRVPGDQAFLTFPYIQQKVTQNVEIDLDSFQPILVPRDGPSFCARRGLPEDGKALVFDVGSTTLLEIYEVFDPLSERYRLGDVRAAVTPEELESTIPQARPYYMSAGLYLPDCMPLWVFEENSNTMIQYDAAASGGQEKLSAQVPRDNFIARRRPDVIGRRDTSVIGEETVLVPSLNDIRESRLYFDQGQDQLLGIHYKTGNVVVIADRAHFEAATGRPLADVTFIEKVLSPDDSSEVLRIFDTESTSLVEATLRYTLMPVVDSEN
ncbi:MAG: VCBS repeat-containing protein, partial [Planctomycetes bacterium]|nr:VCBS repeat-containing protein [Planctomycetota bacterium]